MLDNLARCYFSYWPIERGKWWAWTKLRRHLPVTPRQHVERALGSGIRMRLDPQDEVDRFIYFWNHWEANETWLFERVLRPGDALVDVGANVGYFSLLGARLVGPTGRVLAVEPSPPTVTRLRENVALNRYDTVTIADCAASDCDGTVEITECIDRNSGMNTMRPSAGARRRWTVPALRLDSLIPADWPVRLIKLDIEGAEALALRGLSGLLARPDAPDVLSEIWHEFIRAVSGDPLEPMRLMLHHGYRAYQLGDRSLTPYTMADFERALDANLFFTKRASIPGLL